MVGYLTMQGGNSALNIVRIQKVYGNLFNVMYKAVFSSIFEAFGTAVKGYLQFYVLI